ncbi:hypothetical protein SAMN02745229_02378 [Butyrivibrio fibrisolvens DSM 3071]|uniref:Uncharacterized protein n=1 Tax=Butyrivibrio fibrisolvens DSM 3071 TaxID=1121131 RepID=A0A1M5ZL77_BUTFI|nr:hypothetical protein [Butyrivibrio fibrisolvens]SHI24693.1 hypothetical protein SAMN02745229_02378 [Butyrivibrio fibrisolvens DSM 3071]
MNIVDKLIEFNTTRDRAALGVTSDIEQRTLVVIANDILEWLKLERKRELWIEQGKAITHKPLELNMDYPWCKDLERLLNEDNPLAEVFCIKDNCLTFKDSVSDDYIHEVRGLAHEKYNPPMIKD